MLLYSSLLALAACLDALAALPYVEIVTELDLVTRKTDARAAGNRESARRVRVVTVTDGSSWWIADNWILGGGDGGGGVRWHGDGTNIYQTLGSQGRSTVHLWSTKDNHPLAGAPENLAWLAFCSGDFLRREGRIIPLPADDLRHTRDRYGYTDKTTVFEDGYGLPRTVDLFCSKLKVRASEEAFDREDFRPIASGSIEERLKLVTDMAPAFHFGVVESTNFQGRIYPARFEFTQIARSYEPVAESEWQGAGRVTSIRVVDRPAGVFADGVERQVVDWRFRDETAQVNAIIYGWAGARPPRTDDALPQAEFKRHVERMTKARTASASPASSVFVP